MKQVSLSDAIIISTPVGHPEHLKYKLNNDGSRSDLNVIIQETDYGPMAGIEWMLPTAVAAYLLKPFFEAFLQEAGKDFYELSKSKLTTFIKDNRELRYKYIAATKSTQKLSRHYNQSVTVSVKAMLHSRLMVTVLFDESLPSDQMDEVLEGLFMSLNLLYDQCKEHAPEENVNPRSSHMHEVFMIADPELKEWKLLSKEQMSEIYRNK